MERAWREEFFPTVLLYCSKGAWQPSKNKCAVALILFPMSYVTPPPPLFRIHDCEESGVAVVGARCRLERCELWGNGDCGAVAGNDAHVALAACTLRDHARGRATGVWAMGTHTMGVYIGLAGRVAMGAGCVFLRNAGGEIFWEDGPGPEGE